MLTPPSRPPPSGTWTSASAKYIAAYEKLAAAIRKLSGLPLAISSIQPVGAIFAHCEEFAPTADETEAAASAAGGDAGAGALARFVIQFESSGKWPDDLSAIAALKTAFYLKLAELLEAQAAPLRCDPRRAALAVIVDGVPFIGTIMHSKEEKLLVAAGDVAGAAALARATSAGVAHTAAMHVIASRHAAFGPTARLCKRWLHCQLFSGNFLPQLVEILVASLFSSAAPRPPGSALLGLARFLSLLVTHDFAAEPMVVELGDGLSGDGLTAAIRATAQKAFTAARKSASGALPAIWIATETEPEGSAWCAHGPSVELVRRVRRLAASALLCLERAMCHAAVSHAALPARLGAPRGSSAAPPPSRVLASDAEIARSALRAFAVPLHEFDVLLHLDATRVPHPDLRLASADSTAVALSLRYANLGPRSDAVISLVCELRQAYGDLALFCYDTHGGDVVAVKWRPRAFLPSRFQPDAAQSRLLVARSTPVGGAPSAPASGKGSSKGSTPGVEGAWLLPNAPDTLEAMLAMGRGLVAHVSLQTGVAPSAP